MENIKFKLEEQLEKSEEYLILILYDNLNYTLNLSLVRLFLLPPYLLTANIANSNIINHKRWK